MRLFWIYLFLCLIPFVQAFGNTNITLSTLLKDAAAVDSFYLPRTGFPGVWSSYDRSGGNLDDQGFIRREGDSYVIAEMMGPGAITRIWANQPKGTIEIYVDEGGKPVLSVPAAELFQGKISPFITPWVYAHKESSSYSFIPIPYMRFCKIVTSELFEYEINYQTYPSQTIVEPFKLPVPKPHQTTLTTVSKTMQANGKAPFQVGKDFVEDAYAFTIPAAETVEFATFTGPAIIKGIQIEWDNKDYNLGRDAVLSIFWDGYSEPSVQAPLLDFFACGSNNWLTGISNDNEGYCYFPMPFQKEARLSLRNDNVNDDISIHISVSIQQVKTLPEPLRRFHAAWHYSPAESQDYPTAFDMQRKSPITDLSQSLRLLETNATGHLAAITLTQMDSLSSDIQLSTFSGVREIQLNSSSIHGFLNTALPAKPPAFSFSGITTSPFFSASRLFLPTPVSIEEKSILSMENGHGNLAKQTVSALLYWYQEDQYQPHLYFPPYHARHFRKTTIRKPQFIVDSDRLIPLPVEEAESAELEVSGGVFEPQDMSAFGPDWSQNQQIRFEAFQEEAELKIKLPDVPYSGWYELHGVFTLSPDSGIISIANHDTIIEDSLDLYAESIQPKTYTCPSKLFIHAGEPVVITVIMKGTNPDSSGLNAGIDYLEFTPQSWSPNEITIISPLHTNPLIATAALQHYKLKDSVELPIGYAETSALNNSIEKANTKSKDFSLPAFSTEPAPPDLTPVAMVLFEVHAEQSGIYHFEIQGNPSQNFTFRATDNGLEKSPNRIWVNGIPLQAEERRYWDIDQHDFKPLRYSVPLQKGVNLMMWMMDCNTNVTFTPVFYGLQP